MFRTVVAVSSKAVVLSGSNPDDRHGRTVDFTQCLVLMTSNVLHDGQIREFFRSEFIDRLDEVQTHCALSEEQIHSIVDVQLERLRAHLAEKEITLGLTDAAKDELAREGYDPEFGARPLERALQKCAQDLLADRILAGELSAGDTAVVVFSEGVFRRNAERHEPEPAGAAGRGSGLESQRPSPAPTPGARLPCFARPLARGSAGASCAARACATYLV